MTGGRWKLLSAGVAIGLGSGCVDRRFVVDTNVPGAQVAIDGTPLGPSPADGRREYPGCYTFTASAAGYEPLEQVVKFNPRWYDYPGLDFFAEVLWPFRIEDVRRVRLDLEPLRPVNIGELTARGEELRGAGRSLPPSRVPDAPRQQPATGPTTPLPTTGTVTAPLPGNLLPLTPPVGTGQPGGGSKTRPDRTPRCPSRAAWTRSRPSRSGRATPPDVDGRPENGRLRRVR